MNIRVMTREEEQHFVKVIDLSTPLQELVAYCRDTEALYREGENVLHQEECVMWKSRGDALEALMAEFGLGT